MTETQPKFKPGDRCFTHYDMKWGTVVRETTTYRNQTHGVTGTKLPDTTWYEVRYDNGTTSNLDDAHGDWDMARIVPPDVAKRYGYGSDPKAARLEARIAPETMRRLPAAQVACPACDAAPLERCVVVGSDNVPLPSGFHVARQQAAGLKR